MNEKQYILERDFYYKREITYADRFKFLGVTLLAHFLAYYYMMCFTSLTQIWVGSAFYVVFQAIGLLPIAWLIPFFLIRQYLQARIPKLFSLADEENAWRQKAFRWISLCELLRFLTGLIPLSITRFGVMTSPVTYLLYTLFYIEPLGKFDAVLRDGKAGLLDLTVFFLIYGAYFFLYDYFLVRRIQKEAARHRQYLRGCLREKEKYYDYG